MLRTIAVSVLFAHLLLLCACGGWSPPPGGAAVTIELSSAQTNGPVIPGAAVTITATVYDQSNQGVTWTITPQNFGKLSDETSANQPSIFQTIASVTFTAPVNFSAPTPVTVTATSISNPEITNSFQLKAVPLSVSLLNPNSLLPVPTQTMNPGEQLQLQAFVANDPSNSGVDWSLSPATGAGSLLSVNFSLATYVAPTTITSPTTVSVIATSRSNSNVVTSLPITLFPSGAGPNVSAVTVNIGPVPGETRINGAFTDITLCNPGSNGGSPTCETIGGILIDSGSYGLRILQSQIPSLKLPTMVDPDGNTLENCAELLDGSYLWGPVSKADLYLGGDSTSGRITPTATNLLIQVISGPPASNIPTGCSNNATDRNTPQLLGANGILGVGPEPTDCTLAGKNYCDGSIEMSPPNLYYACPSAGCLTTDSPVIVNQLQQVTNPVFKVCPYCNGLSLDLPPLTSNAASLTGRMIFGIGRLLSNPLGSATVYTLDANDHFTSSLDGQKFGSSFIDSGTSAFLFPGHLSTCSANSQYYCPSSPSSFSAVNKGATQGEGTINFTVDNADSLFSEFPNDAAFSNLAGPEGTLPSCSVGSLACGSDAQNTFVWGLPFFYGRSVFIALDEQSVTGTPPTPWWAF